MRRVPPWQTYDRMAASGEYGPPLEETPPPQEGPDEAAFFRTALAGRKRVLDLGCGPGVLGPHGAWVCGTDASPAMLKLARRSTGGRGDVCLVRGLAEALPFAEGSFDGVVLSGSLCSVRDPGMVLAEVARVTARGTVVAVLVWEFGSIFAGQGARVDRSLRREGDELSLHVVRYLADPYRISHERYVLDTASHPDLPPGGRKTTDVTPAEIPAEMILDAACEEEAQFDPETLEAAFAVVGFTVTELRVEMSFGTPHIFAVFHRA